MARIRKVQLFIGPFKDLLGKGKTGAKLIESTGLSNELKISFNVIKTITGAPNDSVISVTNLAPETRRALREQSLSLELWGGYIDEEIMRIAKGGITSAVHVRKPALIESIITVRDGWGPLLNADYSRSFAGAELLSSVINDIARAIPGIKIGKIKVPGQLKEKGRSLAGNPREILNKLGDSFSFSWSIQDGIFQAISDRLSSGLVYAIKDTLIDVTPILVGPIQIQTGVQITSLLDPRIVPGDTVQVNPVTDPTLAGEYKIFESHMVGSTHDSAWTSTMTSRKYVL